MVLSVFYIKLFSLQRSLTFLNASHYTCETALIVVGVSSR
jgi:hypothetical protein